MYQKLFRNNSFQGVSWVRYECPKDVEHKQLKFQKKMFRRILIRNYV